MEGVLFGDVIDSGASAKRFAAGQAEREPPAARGEMSFPEYRSLSDASKIAIRAAVKDGQLQHLGATERHYAELYRAKNAATGRIPGMRPVRQKRTYQRSSYGGGWGGGYRRRYSRYPRSNPYKRRSAAQRAPTTLRTVARYMGSAPKMAGPVDLAGHSYPITTQSFLQAVGSPFTDVREMPGQVMPRRPDSDFKGASIAYSYQGRATVQTNYPYTGGANASSGALTFAAAFPYGLGGLDFAGNQTASGTGTTNFPIAFTAAGLSSYVINEMLPRLTAGQMNYPLVYNQFETMTKWRATSAGFKQHDVGAVLTRQGEFFAHEVNGSKFLAALTAGYSTWPADVKNALWQFGIRGLLDYNLSITGGTVYNTPPANVRALVDAARQQATSNSDTGAEMTPEMGITQRYREPRSEVDFMSINPLVFIYDPNSTISAGTRMTADAWSTAVSTKYPAGAVGITNYLKEISEPALNVVYQRSGNFAWNTLQTANRSFLLTVDMLPLPFAEGEVFNTMGDQGNSLLCIESSQMAKSAGGDGRVLNTYRACFYEVQAQGTTIMFQTDSPADPSYNQVVELASHFPVTVRGFSFFKSLWEGIKKAAGWIKDNEGSIIKGVQSGVNVAKYIAA